MLKIGPTPVPTVTAPSPEQRKVSMTLGITIPSEAIRQPLMLPQPDRSATLKPSVIERSVGVDLYCDENQTLTSF